MYIVFEKTMSNTTVCFALTEEQIADARCNILFNGGKVKEIARAETVKEMKNITTKTKISYLNSKGEIKFA